MISSSMDPVKDREEANARMVKNHQLDVEDGGQSRGCLRGDHPCRKYSRCRCRKGGHLLVCGRRRGKSSLASNRPVFTKSQNARQSHDISLPLRKKYRHQKKGGDKKALHSSAKKAMALGGLRVAGGIN